ncbi:endonuclease/exonuclease/phosphatase family protein [Winogradskyella litoriviva]|uniref:Endonuclease/exonuclease/phosphatase family protein n=1 Tax=Winogradskyella litoriviva TaxID=1220182 RepID=A0ABX2E4M1_9FLAO|nr:endonuclease/exonuclease/phosphatase family protein [Winogradskyella litoriviva]NRD23018.1 endonuclease/exonuclease/phosphatase family protein [Winogradskyella litoriviva]
MKRFVKKRKLILVLNLSVVILLLIVCFREYIGFNRYFILSFLGFFVPYLVLANVLFVLYWMLKRKRQLIISLAVLIYGYFANDTFFKFNNSENYTKHELSILTFNAHTFAGFYKFDKPNVSEDIVDFIAGQNPDIVCFQEYSFKMNNRFADYPYKYLTPESSGSTLQAILSKYPIISGGSFNFDETINNAIYADIKIQNDTIRVYNVHLESFKVRPGSLKREVPTNIFNRMDLAFQKQTEQAKLIKKHSLNTKHKKLICGDFNSTQYSNVYNILKGDMKDSFLEEGIGFGNTFNFRILSFRIDIILSDFKINSHKNFEAELSDHEPVMAKFDLHN